MREAAAGSRNWLRRHSAELRLSLRVTVSGVLSYALAELFGLAQGYWAVITAVIVVQTSIGGSLKAGIDRLLGTLGGAAYGALVALLIPHTAPAARGAAVAAAVAPLALLAAVRANFRIAPVTAVIVLLSNTGTTAGPLASAIARVGEIGLGCIVGLGVSLLVLPARAHRLLVDAISRTLALFAEQIGALSPRLAGGGDPARVQALSDRLRSALRQVDALAREAERERRSRLTEAPDPEPLIRSLRRLRSDFTFIARTAGPLAAPSLQRLGSSFADATQAVAEALRGVGGALAAGAAPPIIDDALAAIDRCAAAIDSLGRAPLTPALSGDEAGRIFALSFALGQLREDLGELTARAARFTHAAAVKA